MSLLETRLVELTNDARDAVTGAVERLKRFLAEIEAASVLNGASPRGHLASRTHLAFSPASCDSALERARHRRRSGGAAGGPGRVRRGGGGRARRPSPRRFPSRRRRDATYERNKTKRKKTVVASRRRSAFSAGSGRRWRACRRRRMTPRPPCCARPRRRRRRRWRAPAAWRRGSSLPAARWRRSRRFCKPPRTRTRARTGTRCGTRWTPRSRSVSRTKADSARAGWRLRATLSRLTVPASRASRDWKSAASTAAARRRRTDERAETNVSSLGFDETLSPYDVSSDGVTSACVASGAAARAGLAPALARLLAALNVAAREESVRNRSSTNGLRRLRRRHERPHGFDPVGARARRRGVGAESAGRRARPRGRARAAVHLLRLCRRYARVPGSRGIARDAPARRARCCARCAFASRDPAAAEGLRRAGATPKLARCLQRGDAEARESAMRALRNVCLIGGMAATFGFEPSGNRR